MRIAQLRGDMGRAQEIPRIVKGNPSTSGHSVRAGKPLDDDETSDTQSSAASPVKKEFPEEEESTTVTTLFGVKTITPVNEKKRKASGELSAVGGKKGRNALEEVSALKESRIEAGHWANLAAETLNQAASLQLIATKMADGTLSRKRAMTKITETSAAMGDAVTRMKGLYGIDIMPTEGEEDDDGVPTVMSSKEFVDYAKKRLQGN